MIGGKMIGHRPISTSQHHPGAQRRQLRTGAIEAEQGQRGHGGRKPGKGMNLATSPQNECENRRRRPSRGLAHTPGTPIFALFRWTSERAASIRCPDGGSGQGSFASFLKGPLPPSGHRIERGTIDLQSDINCLPERSLLGAFGKQHDDYDHDVFNSAGSTLATPHFGPENAVHLTVDSDPASVLLPPSARRILCACLPAPYTRTPSRDEWPTSSQRFQHPRDVISFQSFDSIAIRCHQRYQRLRPFLGAVGHDLYQLKCRVLFGTQSTPPPAQRPTAHPELRCNRLSTRAPLHPLPKVGYRLRSQTP